MKTHDAGRHPAMSTHRVGISAPGVLVTMGVAWACVVGLHARGFLLVSVVAGAAASAMFKYWYAHKPPEVRRLSIK